MFAIVAACAANLHMNTCVLKVQYLGYRMRLAHMFMFI